MNSKLPLALSTALALTLAGCSKTDTNQVAETAPEKPTSTTMTTDATDSNPFFNESPLYMYYPQLDKI